MAPSLQVDFIGIGAPKCGTTWLFYALGQHPKICLSEPKETGYFDRDDFWISCGHDRREKSEVDHNHLQDLTLYTRHYKHCLPSSLKGEFSTKYMYNEKTPARIHQHFPHVKLLACLRNPVDWAYSWYLARRDYYGAANYKTFEDQLEYDPGFLDVGYYARYLKNYLKYFAKEQVAIIQFDDIKIRPEQTVRGLFEFLDVDPGVELDLDAVPKNRTRKSRFGSPVPLMKRVSGWLIEHDQAALLRKIRNLGVERLILSLTTVRGAREPMNPQARERLRRLYREDIDELESLFGLDLAAWK